MDKETNILENEFERRLSVFISEKGLDYKIIREPNFSDYTDDKIAKNRRADMMILKGEYPFMLVEVKSLEISRYVNLREIQSSVFELELLGADYKVYTDIETLLVVDVINKTAHFYESFDDIYAFFDTISNSEIEQQKSIIVNHIKKVINESELPLESPQFSGKTTKKLINELDISEYISYNEKGRFFHFTTNPELGLDDFENQFFQTLLNPVAEQAVCRYTTFDSLFHMLNNKTYRMGSDIAMNDRGEIDYVDKYIGLHYKPLQSLSISELENLNNSYISSCTTINKKDDLTMYRLYGEDSKGVCLCFNVTDRVQNKNLLLRKISYATSSGNHPELDVIKNIISNFSSKVYVRFRFLYLDVWKHFFKTYDYSVEEEVRLLYLNNKLYPPKKQDWVITNPDKILSRFVLFDIEDENFPLHLDKIIVGPNCPESLLNRRQIEVLLRERKLQYVKAENSKIESYRKT